MFTPGRFLAAVFAVGVVAGCSAGDRAPADSAAVAAATAPAGDAAADEAAIRGINAEWFRLYNAQDGAALAALYTDDAVLMMPGAATIRGRDAIKAAYEKDMAATATAGLTNTLGSNSEAAASGDLAYESNTFTVTDKAGKVVESGKYLTVFARRDGKWAIVRDMWNSDTPANTQ
jgi:uncharacterized protein (TIGR02246 family)